MVFSSILFLFGFFVVFFLGYYSVPYKFKNAWALLGSTVFYAWGGPLFVFVLFASLTADYYIALQFNKSSKKKQWLTLGLVLNIGLLAYFKYANFFVDNLNSLLVKLGMDEAHWTEVALPIGISFFTFQKISYLIDVYRGEKEAQKDWSKYALFVVLFPQLIAGPIVRYKEISDQIEDRRKNLIPEERLLGIFRFSIGLAKKVLIANTMGELADSYFDQPNWQGLTTIEATVALLAYTFQIYFDFSGYSDMAIGLGRMMGFHFPENFNFPYLANSITDFWRRWHITLSHWMRDYLYIPLGGNRKGGIRTYVNLWTVFLISGLWHGASWNFVIWGAYHGFWLVLERAFLLRIYRIIPNIFRVAITFGLAAVGWLFFRIESLDASVRFKNAFLHPNLNHGVELKSEYIVTFILAIVFSFWNVNKWTQRKEEKVYSTLSVSKAIFITVVTFILLFVSASYVISADYNPFIYFRF